VDAAHYTVRNEPSERTIYIRMEGYFDLEEMKNFIRAAFEATESYNGTPHLVLADMRGMQITSLEVSKLLGEYIGEARRKGVSCCAHLSTSTVQKLQAARLARQNSPGDDVTVNVVSIEEAHALLGEARRQLEALPRR
jgi:hypothetical protein